MQLAWAANMVWTGLLYLYFFRKLKSKYKDLKNFCCECRKEETYWLEYESILRNEVMRCKTDAAGMDNKGKII